MIEKLEHFSSKTFDDYTNPSDLSFSKNNIIFGYNGRGKSTLASGIIKHFVNTGKSEDSYRFFNSDYVKDSLLLQDSEGHNKLKGVVANFGKKDADLEANIRALKEQLIDCNKIELDLAEKETSLREVINSIHDRRKGNAKISRKQQNIDILKVVELYYNDLAQAKLKEPDETKLSQMVGDDRFNKTIIQLESIIIESVEAVNSDVFSTIKMIATHQYDTDDIPSSTIIDWLNEGVQIHNETSSEICLFCGHRINIKSIQNKIKLYNENQIQKDTVILKDFEITLNGIIKTINDNLQLFPQLREILPVNLREAEKQLNDYIVSITSFRNSLLSKIEDMKNYKFDPDNNLEIAINSIIKITTTLQEQIHSEITVLRSRDHDKELLVKGSIGLEIKQNKDIQRRIAEISDLHDELNKSKSSNKETIRRIRELTSQKSSTSDFAAFITGILSNLGIRFKISPDSDNRNYIITLAETDQELTVSDISEGERNILALLFFYYELYTDNNQQDFKNEIELIVVDDPISSLDEVNHMYILNLVEQILSVPLPQVFIFTHIWEDICTLDYKFNHSNSDNSYFEVKKNAEGKSYLTKLRANINPYNHHFAEVYDFSNKQLTDNLSDCDIYHMPNIIRLVLEGFLSNKTKHTSPTKANEKEIAKILFNKEWTSISEDKKTELGELLLVANVNSHHIHRNPEQVQRAAKFLMNRIKDVDKVHFDSFKTA